MKNKETLEEAFKTLKEQYPILNEYNLHHLLQIARFGAKWQEEQDKNMYSEEDIVNALHSVELKDNKNYSKIYEGMKEWFEQSKNK